MMARLEKIVRLIAELNGYRWRIETERFPARISILFSHADPLKSWMFHALADSASELSYKVQSEFIPACRNLGLKLPGDEPKPVSCKGCGGELVKIRGRYPKDRERIVCPTCQADALADIYERLSPKYNVPSTELPK